MSTSAVGEAGFDELGQFIVHIEKDCEPDHTIIIYDDESIPADNVWGDSR